MTSKPKEQNINRFNNNPKDINCDDNNNNYNDSNEDACAEEKSFNNEEYQQYLEGMERWLNYTKQEVEISKNQFQYVFPKTYGQKLTSLTSSAESDIIKIIKEQITTRKGISLIRSLQSFEIRNEVIPYFGNGCVVKNFSSQCYSSPPTLLSHNQLPFDVIYWLSSPEYIYDSEDNNDNEDGIDEQDNEVDVIGDNDNVDNDNEDDNGNDNEDNDGDDIGDNDNDDGNDTTIYSNEDNDSDDNEEDDIDDENDKKDDYDKNCDDNDRKEIPEIQIEYVFITQDTTLIVFYFDDEPNFCSFPPSHSNNYNNNSSNSKRYL